MASAAADARGLLRDQRLFLRESKDRVVVLDNRHSVREDRASHHGSAHQDLAGLFLVTAAETDRVVDHSSDRKKDIAGLGNCVAVNGHSLLNERHSVLEILSQERDRCDIGYDASEVSGKDACVACLSGHFIDQYALCSLGIACLQRECLDIRDALLREHSVELIDRVLLVVLLN